MKKTAVERNKNSFYFGKIIASVSFFIVFFILLFLFHSFSSGMEDGKIYYEEGRYQKAAASYYKVLKIKKIGYEISKIFNLKNKSKLYYEINDLLLEVAACYAESGDIKKALVCYEDVLSRFSKNSQDEALRNYIKLQIALCFSSLGYFDKALPILTELEKWYPQNLIALYLNMRDYTGAKRILFSGEIQDKINEGDDIDAASLSYLLSEYYKQTGQYDKAFQNYAPETPVFEAELMERVNYADLYFRVADYEKSAKIYTDLINNPDFSQKIQNKMKLKYAIVLSKMGEKAAAKNLIEEIKNTLTESYRLSPEIICTGYYYAYFTNNKKQLKEVLSLYKSLNLTPESSFYNNIDDFCAVNMQYY